MIQPKLSDVLFVREPECDGEPEEGLARSPLGCLILLGTACWCGWIVWMAVRVVAR